MRILVAEDDDFLADGLSMSLQHNGYKVDVARTGEDADTAAIATNYDLVILDLGLPGVQGLEVLTRLRKRQQTVPVLILTALDSVEDRVRGLDLGANDYLTKPFHLPELEARIRALTRKEVWQNQTSIEVGLLNFDTVSRAVTVQNKLLECSPREIAVIERLLQQPGKLVSKKQLAEHLSTFDEDVTANAIDITMHRLRRKLDGANIDVRTLRGLGYLIEKRN